MPLKIFRITADHAFWALLPVQKDFVERKLFQLESMRADWADFSFYVRDPARTKKGNFFSIRNGSLCYDATVYDSDLGETIERSGEVLPARFDGSNEKFSIFNPTACYNCFDREQSVARWVPDGTVAIQVEKYAFHVDRIGDCNLFKIPEMKHVGLFALVGRDEPEDEFYSQYHDLGFTGLKFEEVWSGEGELEASRGAPRLKLSRSQSTADSQPSQASRNTIAPILPPKVQAPGSTARRREISRAMKVYQVTADLGFWSLQPAQKEFVQRKLFQLEPMRGEWTDLSFYVRDPVRTQRGNFFNLSLGALSYDAIVYDSDLGETIERSGEVLPARLDGTNEKFYVFNPTACYNCFDREHSVAEWTPDGTVAIQVKKFAFHADRIGDCNLFKIPEMKRVGLFALVGRDEPEDEFYSQYHALGFTGLKFEEIWSCETEDS